MTDERKDTTCIATFFNHFGAIRYKKLCERELGKAKLCPVPRSLSSSCGTCVRYSRTPWEMPEKIPEEVEQIVRETPEGYVTLYRAENS